MQVLSLIPVSYDLQPLRTSVFALFDSATYATAAYHWKGAKTIIITLIACSYRPLSCLNSSYASSL